MGNFVQVEAFVPPDDLPATCALGGVADPEQLSVDELKALVQSDESAGRFTQCWKPTGWVATYMHLQDITVEKGDIVVYGETMGHIDNTGNSTGAHLHYQINMPGADGGKGSAIDPAPTMAETYSDALRALPRRQR